MNRIQFFILTLLSSLVVVLLVGHIYLEYQLLNQTNQANIEQNRLAQAEQVINQGQAFQANLKQVALRIVQDIQKTQNQGLKDLLDREQIKYTPGPESAPAPETPASPTPAPATPGTR